MGTGTVNTGEDLASTNFLQSVKQLFDVENINIKAIDALFKDPQNEPAIKDQASELISFLSRQLSEESNYKNVHLFYCCLELIELVSSKSNPQDALLQLIEEVENSPDDTRLLALLKPLSNVLKVISPKKQVDALAWSLNSLQIYIHSTIVVEKTHESEYSEDFSSSLDSFPFSYDRLSLYYSLEPFYSSLIRESRQYDIDYVQVLAKYLIQLLEKPFARLDLKQPIAEEVTRNITNLIIKVHYDPFAYLITSKLSNDQVPSRLGLAMFFYIINSEDSWFKNKRTPRIYNPLYIFQHSLPLVTALLQQYNEPGVEKGLFLVSQLMKRIGLSEAPYRLLDSLEHNNFCLELSRVISYNCFKATRKDALNVLDSYLNIFEIRGQYLIIFNLISSLTKANLQGFLIDKYRGILTKEIKNGEHNMSEYCKGSKLLAMLDLLLDIIVKNLDLVEIMDHNTATLNLLRFLVLCDRKHNYTGIWDFLPHLQEDYLKRIRVIIQENRARYSQKIKELEQGNSETCATEVKVLLQQQELNRGGFNVEEKLAMFRSYFTPLEFIESLICRIEECASLVSDETA